MSLLEEFECVIYLLLSPLTHAFNNRRTVFLLSRVFTLFFLENEIILHFDLKRNRVLMISSLFDEFITCHFYGHHYIYNFCIIVYFCIVVHLLAAIYPYCTFKITDEEKEVRYFDKVVLSKNCTIKV